MAKVIQTILNLRDNMSGGLMNVVRNTQGVTREMRTATQGVINFKNKAVGAIKDFAKKSAVLAGGALAGGVAAFFSADNLTEEFRIAQQNVKTAFESMGSSSAVAQEAYRGLYSIMGDTGAATEAAQLLSNIAKTQEDVASVTKIAAGVYGKFSTALPIENLIENMNLASQTSEVSGGLADALEWVGINIDDYSKKLQGMSSQEERAKTIVSTLTDIYSESADVFYKNNAALVASRNNQTTFATAVAKIGDISANVKNKLLEMAGAQEDGSFRAGSVLAIVQGNVDGLLAKISEWTSSGGADEWASRASTAVQTFIDTVKTGFDWIKQNKDTIIGAIKGIAGAFVAIKTVKLVGDMAGAINTMLLFGQTIGTIASAGIPKLVSGISGIASGISGAFTAISGFVAANPIVLIIAGVVAAGILIYKNWDTIKAAAISLWEKAKEVFAGFKETVGNAFQAVKEKAIALKDGFVSAFTGIKDGIVGAFEAAREKISGFFSWIDEKISSIPILGSIYGKGKEVVGGIAGWIGGKIGANATGTSYWRGGLTSINEHGGEIVNLPNGAKIIPHDISEAEARESARLIAARNTPQLAYSGAGNQISMPLTINVQGNMIGNEQAANQFGEIIVGKVMDALRNL